MAAALEKAAGLWFHAGVAAGTEQVYVPGSKWEIVLALNADQKAPNYVNEQANQQLRIAAMKTKIILAAFSLALGAASAFTACSPRQSSPADAQNILPRAEQPFGGKIGRTSKDSTPDFPKGVEAPKGAPNILIILTDDVGFGASSTFGGPIPTPTMDHLANNGLRPSATPWPLMAAWIIWS